MWIRTQNKQMIINSDQVIDIFVDRTGTKVMAETTRDGDFFTLGTYENRDTCLGIVEHILIAISKSLPMTVIPFGGNVDEWYEIVESANFE